MRRRVLLSALLTAMPLSLGVVLRPGASRAEVAPIEVEAARMEFDRKAGVARFEGEVRVRQADLELRCARLTATYSKAGEVRFLEIEGGLMVTLDAQAGLTARAARATLDRETGELKLSGEPEVVRGKDRLRGERITLFTETGRIVVEGARGVVHLPRLRPELPGLPPSAATRGP
jgi:lipopolysaccharide export system protein LptA